MMNQYQAKYKMYIISHRSFVSDYEGYGRGKMSGKRYCEWACLIRNYYGDIGLFGDPMYVIPFYSLLKGKIPLDLLLNVNTELFVKERVDKFKNDITYIEQIKKHSGV